ncbi:PadR family transcriptional regulator [Companilactobacillus sp. HBUAS56257]|uniref:PadR family transcriptional regulator n=1 Tax=Companilactobacillus sp. HBUAS56257 TaxID=3109360 RepID=UPI002FEFEACA
MYDLFVLGQLMDESMSGYLMRQILQQLVGSSRKISFGMIYPLFKRLDEAGFIELHETKESGRVKKVATITENGRQQFFKLMEKKIPVNSNLEFTYNVKFRNFHQINENLRQQILRDYCQYLTQEKTLLQKQMADLPRTNISKSDLQNALWVNDLKAVKIEAALKWANDSLNKLEK